MNTVVGHQEPIKDWNVSTLYLFSGMTWHCKVYLLTNSVDYVSRPFNGPIIWARSDLQRANFINITFTLWFGQLEARQILWNAGRIKRIYWALWSGLSATFPTLKLELHSVIPLRDFFFTPLTLSIWIFYPFFFSDNLVFVYYILEIQIFNHHPAIAGKSILTCVVIFFNLHDAYLGFLKNRTCHVGKIWGKISSMCYAHGIAHQIPKNYAIHIINTYHIYSMKSLLYLSKIKHK